MNGLKANLSVFYFAGGYDVLFFILLGLTVGLGITNFLLCLFDVLGFRSKKRWFLIYLSGEACIVAALGFSAVDGMNALEILTYPLFLFGTGLAVFLPSVFFSVKSFVVKYKENPLSERPFVREERSEESCNPIDFMKKSGVAERIIKTLNAKEIKTENKKAASVDSLRESDRECNLSHVKNVLDRMDYYNLSPQDRKQVESLKTLVLKAENFSDDERVREQLNDGLNSLLKIMSKYKV